MGLRRPSNISVLTALLCALAALGWGLAGLFDFNPVHRVLGKRCTLARLAYGIVGLAGAWTTYQLSSPVLMTVFAGRRRGSFMPAKRRSILGQWLPRLEGRALSGRSVRLPDDAAGKVALLALGFAYSARWDVEAWVDAFRNRFANRDNFTYYEMPMIGGLARLAAPMIEAGMRNGTPAELRDHVVTIYGSMGPIREALGLGEENTTHILLIGRDGTVLFESRNGLDAARFERLASVTELALGAADSQSGQRAV